ncbi:MAG: flippase-like domain-containing protein [bacterium]|nr:flippase-like domain-containing protein [bacterium]
MRYVKILLIVGIVGVLLYFFFQDVNFGEVIAIIKGLNPIYPVVFFTGLFLQFFIRAYRWGLLLKPHKEKIPLATLYNYTVIGFLISTILPGRLGEPAKGMLLASEEKISRSYGLASVVLERLIDSLMIVLLFLTSLFFIKESQSKFLADVKQVSYFIVPVIVLILILFYLVNTNRVFRYVEKLIYFFSKFIPAKIREKAVSFLLNFVKGLRLNLGVWDFLKLSLSSLLVWIFFVPFYWFLMQGFEFGSRVGLLETVPYFSIIVAAAAIPTPGMAGSLDAASRHGLEQLYGVETNTAAAYTLLVHFIIIAVIIIPGLVALWSKGLNLKTIRSLKENKKGEEK